MLERFTWCVNYFFFPSWYLLGFEWGVYTYFKQIYILARTAYSLLEEGKHFFSIWEQLNKQTKPFISEHNNQSFSYTQTQSQEIFLALINSLLERATSGQHHCSCLFLQIEDSSGCDLHARLLIYAVLTWRNYTASKTISHDYSVYKSHWVQKSLFWIQEEKLWTSQTQDIVHVPHALAKYLPYVKDRWDIL